MPAARRVTGIMLFFSLFGLPGFLQATKVYAFPGITIKKSRDKEVNPVVVVETTRGPFKLLVYTSETPVTANNFLELVEKGIYNGTSFHRYDPRFCIQGGDPTGTGSGGSGKTVPLEISKKLRHSQAGMVGMAHARDRNSASSQFYIILSPQSGLDDDFAIFARVIEGLEAVFSIREGDTMTSLYLDGSKKENKTVAKNQTGKPATKASKDKPGELE